MKRAANIFGLLIIACLVSGCQTPFHYSWLEVVAFSMIALIIALFFILANYSNILRDEVSDFDEFDANAIRLQQKQKRKLVTRSRPFSLTKVQFGLWTVIISSSYIYLSLLKGDCAEGPINRTALVLMGIFAGTAVASNLINKQEINDSRPRHQNAPSEGFFIDILSDDNGISLHRFQNLVWTLIAMTVYLYKVSIIHTGCILPELSDTLLALTGISNATYLVLRTKENAPPIQEARELNSTDDTGRTPVQPGDVTSANDIPKRQLVS